MIAALNHRSYARLTAQQVAAELTERTVLCLPVGALEQHGPHLPLNTDTVIAERFAHCLAQIAAPEHDLWVAPPLNFGLSPEHAWSAGTITFDITLYVALVETLLREHLRAAPAKAVLIVNGHGGNSGVLQALVQQFQREHNAVICVLNIGAITGGQLKPGHFDAPEIHAGALETALMLALAPDHVRLDLLPASSPSGSGHAEAVRQTILDRAAAWAWSSNDPALANSGVIGNDPRTADADLGRRLLTGALGECGAVLDRLTTPTSHILDQAEEMKCVSPPMRRPASNATA